MCFTSKEDISNIPKTVILYNLVLISTFNKYIITMTAEVTFMVQNLVNDTMDRIFLPIIKRVTSENELLSQKVKKTIFCL